VGWSHGNEKLQGDRPDWAKGSYYGNPLVDAPSDDVGLLARVRKTPSWPRSWASFSLL
jgi:hypothetical protein